MNANNFRERPHRTKQVIHFDIHIQIYSQEFTKHFRFILTVQFKETIFSACE